MDVEKIDKLGYDVFFEKDRMDRDLSDFTVARVTAEYRGSYKAKTADDEYMAQITGRRLFHAVAREDYPAVGDFVVLDKIHGDKAVIHDILSRKTILKRRINETDDVQVIATNIDVAFIVESIDRDYNLNRFERYCAIARDGDIEPVAILNKIDLISGEEKAKRLEEILERLGDTKIIFTSVMSGEGIDEINDYITKNKTYCFLGSSGVGKSSLINVLLGQEKLKVSEIGEYADRGRHTTTNREMYFLKNGGIVIDNPGIREVGIAEIKTGIDEQFNAITFSAKKCKFADCTHEHEPGCGVLSDVRSGEVDEEEYRNYIGLKKESQYHGMTKREKKVKSKKFGKFIKTTKNELSRYGHKDYGK